MYILSFSTPLEKIEDGIIYVTVPENFPEEARNIIESAVKHSFKRYRFEGKRAKYEVICQVFTDSNGDKAILIPYYLIPGRKYPIYVYIYAIELYCSNPKISQRKAAEETKKRFNLEKFSHTTVGRAFKALEKSIAQETRPAQSGGAANPAQTECDGAQPSADAPQGRMFPSIRDTYARREKMAAFLKDMCEGDGAADIIEKCRRIVGKWYGKHRRLLI